MYGDHPKFCARLQTISVKDTPASNLWRLESGLQPKFSVQKPAPQAISATNKIT
jgi:hypothetical protein